MNSFVQPGYSPRHAGVERFERGISYISGLLRGLDSTRSVSAMLLAAMVSALIVVADQLIDSWADGDLLAAWVVLWVVGFAAVALLAAPARGMALRLMGGFTHRVQQAAQRRADARLIQLAQQDPRVLSELQSAVSRQD